MRYVEMPSPGYESEDDIPEQEYLELREVGDILPQPQFQGNEEYDFVVVD